mgnify:CR=1 FL=1
MGGPKRRQTRMSSPPCRRTRKKIYRVTVLFRVGLKEDCPDLVPESVIQEAIRKAVDLARPGAVLYCDEGSCPHVAFCGPKLSGEHSSSHVEPGAGPGVHEDGSTPCKGVLRINMTTRCERGYAVDITQFDSRKVLRTINLVRIVRRGRPGAAPGVLGAMVYSRHTIHPT